MNTLHNRFAALSPTVPFVEFGAALPGYSPHQLQEVLNRVEGLTPVEQVTLLEGMH